MLAILRRDSRILLQPQCLQVPQVVVELVVLNKLQGLALTFQGEVGFYQPRLLEGGGGFFLAAGLVVGRGQFAEGPVTDAGETRGLLEAFDGAIEIADELVAVTTVE